MDGQIGLRLFCGCFINNMRLEKTAVTEPSVKQDKEDFR